MSLLSKPTDLREKVIANKEKSKRGDELSHALLMQFEEINSINYFPQKSVETLLLKQAQFEVEQMGQRPDYPREFPKFSPSSADKCERELFYKIARTKGHQDIYPFQQRWTRNSTAIHSATQRQLLESEVLLNNPAFTVARLDSGLPAWEKPLESWKLVTHNGVQFVVTGMMDGQLIYQKDGSRIGFEYKTKSNSPSQVKQLKEPASHHKAQCVGYSVLFGIDEFLITYEAVAKDKWTSYADARPDMKIFYYKVTERDRKLLLDKFARITMNIQDGEVSTPDFSKCNFCPFKQVCSGV